MNNMGRINWDEWEETAVKVGDICVDSPVIDKEQQDDDFIDWREPPITGREEAWLSFNSQQ